MRVCRGEKSDFGLPLLWKTRQSQRWGPLIISPWAPWQRYYMLEQWYIHYSGLLTTIPLQLLRCLSGSRGWGPLILPSSALVGGTAMSENVYTHSTMLHEHQNSPLAVYIGALVALVMNTTSISKPTTEVDLLWKITGQTTNGSSRNFARVTHQYHSSIVVGPSFFELSSWEVPQDMSIFSTWAANSRHSTVPDAAVSSTSQIQEVTPIEVLANTHLRVSIRKATTVKPHSIAAIFRFQIIYVLATKHIASQRWEFIFYGEGWLILDSFRQGLTRCAAIHA